MIGGVRLGDIMVDCDDDQALCEFYHALLGWERREMYGMPALIGQDGGVLLLFAHEAGYAAPTWPNQVGEQQKQMHIDFQVPDLAAAVECAEALGAVKTGQQFGGNDWTTMLDPAGHPFCLCAQ